LGKRRRPKLTAMIRTRGGLSVRRRWISIVAKMRERHTCPRCGMKAVKRVSVGVWECRKCGFKFSGGAYTPSTKVGEAMAKKVKG